MEDNENENILIHCVECIKYIHNGKRVFVHCRAGISRSSSIVIAYMMYVNKLSYENAKEFVQNKRNVIAPNESFQNQLREFEDILLGCNYDLDIINAYMQCFKT